jgi:trans-aconitate 2-methyltransferase
VSEGDRAAYAFGDSGPASARLARVAALFEPSTRAFLARVAGRPGRRVLDLGCGPGHTTRLLAETFGDATVVGIDRSDAFLAEARQAAAPRTRFVAADVARGPLPAAPADRVYARFVLSHLPARPAVLRTWFDALAHGGVLLVEEPDAIDTDDDVFRTYLGVTAGLMADHGGDLFVGLALSGMAAALGGRLFHDATTTVAPVTGDIAAVFALNLSVWRADPWVAARHGPDALDAVAAGLAARAVARDRGRITWRLRQLAVERG